MINKKNGLLICSGTYKKKNIGDYIQTVAQEQFFDHIDCYVEREKLSEYRSEVPTLLIMNAWYMWNPQNFPPSSDIIPLYISMHIMPRIADRMLNSDAIAHLKKYEPIGARDIGTMHILKSKGIDSYFSGCLTLSLGEKYKTELKSGEVVFVDPYFELGCTSSQNRFLKITKGLFLLMRHFSKARRINKIFGHEFSSPLRKLFSNLDQLIHSASFYHSYSTAFSDDILFNATYINHTINQSDFRDDNEKLEYAKSLIRKYAAAKLVVSSRIHCILPCVGLETPSIFITSESLEKGNGRGGSNGRFEGLLDFMNVVKMSNQGIRLLGDEDWLFNLKNNKITHQSIVKVQMKHIGVVNDMKKRINMFMSDTE